MRGTVARRIRKEAYGDHASNSSSRKYYRDSDTGTINAEPMRKRYQQLKREHIRG